MILLSFKLWENYLVDSHKFLKTYANFFNDMVLKNQYG